MFNAKKTIKQKHTHTFNKLENMKNKKMERTRHSSNACYEKGKTKNKHKKIKRKRDKNKHENLARKKNC